MNKTIDQLKRERDELIAASEQAYQLANKFSAALTVARSHNMAMAMKLDKLTGDKSDFIIELEACRCPCCIEALSRIHQDQAPQGACGCAERYASQQCECAYCRRCLHNKAEGYL